MKSVLGHVYNIGCLVVIMVLAFGLFMNGYRPIFAVDLYGAEQRIIEQCR